MPALVPDAARAAQVVELGLLGRGSPGVVEGGPEAGALQQALGPALDDLGGLNPQAVVERGHDIHGVDVLVADLATRLDALGPADDERVSRAALVIAIAFVELERRAEPHGPAVGVVIVGLFAAQHVQVLQVLFDVIGNAVEEFVLVDRAIGAALAAGTVVGEDDDDRVVHLPGLLQVVQQASDLGIGVADVAGVDFRHAAEQALLIFGERVPGPRHIEVRPGLALGAAHISIRVEQRQFSVLRHQAHSLLVGQYRFAVAFVAQIEPALILVRPLFPDVVRGVSGTRAEVHQPRLFRSDDLGVARELNGFVHQVLGKVIPILGPVGWINRVVVLHQVGVPLVGLAAQEAVVALKAPAQRPQAPGGGYVGFFFGGQVPFTHSVGIPALLH